MITRTCDRCHREIPEGARWWQLTLVEATKQPDTPDGPIQQMDLCVADTNRLTRWLETTEGK